MAFENAPNAWVAVLQKKRSDLQSNERFQRMFDALTATQPSVQPAKPKVLVGRDGIPLVQSADRPRGGLR